MIEDQLKEALERLPKVEGLTLSVVAPSQSQGADAILKMTYEAKRRRFKVQARTDLTTTGVDVLSSRLSREQATNVLVYAPYINPTCADRLRQRGVCFIDGAGHVFIHAPGLYLFMSGKVETSKRERWGGHEVRKPNTRPFKQVTLKLVYAFLVDPALDMDEPSRALINTTYRDMRERTGLSLGSISNVVEDLIAEEFLIEANQNQRMLVNRQKLFERWVQDYGTRLRPKLVTGHYRPARENWWKDAVISTWGGLWGGEVAGAKLTQYLKPETATIYSDTIPDNFIVQHDLRKDPVGAVEVLKPFWRSSQSAGLDDCAHPLIVYADLAASNIDRNLETAERIYEQYIRRVIESD